VVQNVYGKGMELLMFNCMFNCILLTSDFAIIWSICVAVRAITSSWLWASVSISGVLVYFGGALKFGPRQEDKDRDVEMLRDMMVRQPDKFSIADQNVQVLFGSSNPESAEFQESLEIVGLKEVWKMISGRNTMEKKHSLPLFGLFHFFVLPLCHCCCIEQEDDPPPVTVEDLYGVLNAHVLFTCCVGMWQLMYISTTPSGWLATGSVVSLLMALVNIAWSVTLDWRSMFADADSCRLGYIKGKHWSEGNGTSRKSYTQQKKELTAKRTNLKRLMMKKISRVDVKQTAKHFEEAVKSIRKELEDDVNGIEDQLARLEQRRHQAEHL